MAGPVPRWRTGGSSARIWSVQAQAASHGNADDVALRPGVQQRHAGDAVQFDRQQEPVLLGADPGDLHIRLCQGGWTFGQTRLR